jgi:thiol-disulfide isomerase/thioredoxin/sugar lactone lactonase YvrE
MMKNGFLGGLLFAAMVLMGSFVTAAFAASSFDRLATGGVGGWLNVTRPVTAEDMKGRMVLLDFWTYGCINCMQVIPDLEYLEHKFGDSLLIIGVHSAKFQGEQGNDRILAAAQRFGLKHPVANDSDFAIWKSFGVGAWPTLVLLGPDGKEVARYSGEGHRDEIEQDVQKNIGLVTAKSLVGPLVATDTDQSVLSFPSRIKLMGEDFLIADSGHHRFVVVGEDGKIKITIGSGVRGFKDGDLKTAQFNNPRGMESLGKRIIVADTGNHALREVNLETGQVTTLAGTGKRGFSYNIFERFSAGLELASPWDVAFIPDQRKTQFAVALAGTHQLGLYDVGTKKLTLLAGNGREDIVDGDAKESELAQPSGLSVTNAGVIYFVDAESSALRALRNGKVETLIGTGLFDFGHEDGTYPQAQLQHPQGLWAVDGIVYVADTYNNALRVYDESSKTLSTLKLEDGELSEPGSVLLKDMTLYVADTNHHQIKKVDLKTGKVSDFSIKN